MRSFYEVLKVRRDATAEEIRQAYFCRIKESHPDHGGDSKLFMNILKGYKILSDPKVRGQYDVWLKERERKERESPTENRSKTYSSMKGDSINDSHVKTKRSLTFFQRDLILVCALVFIVGGIIMYVNFLRSVEAKEATEELYEATEDLYTYGSSDGEDYHPEPYMKQSDLQNDGDRGRHSDDKAIPASDDYVPLKGYIPMPSDELDRRARGQRKYNQSHQEESSPQYTITHFLTGESPYYDYYGNGSVDSESLSQLTIKNGSNRDAVVLLVTTKDNVIRNVFVKSGAVYVMDKIPQSRCIVRVMYGRDWNSNKDNGPKFPKGGFMREISFMKTPWNDPFDFYTSEYSDGTSYPTYSITLHAVKDGNLKRLPSNIDEFFEK